MSCTPEECDAFWGLADKNGDGTLTLKELSKAMKAFSFAVGDLTDRDIADFFLHLDQDGDGRVSKQEFLDEMMVKPPRSLTLRQIFQQHDTDGVGWLSRSEIRDVIREANICEPEDVADVADPFFEMADLNNDGRITFTEFMKAFS